MPICWSNVTSATITSGTLQAFDFASPLTTLGTNLSQTTSSTTWTNRTFVVTSADQLYEPLPTGFTDWTIADHVVCEGPRTMQEWASTPAWAPTPKFEEAAEERAKKLFYSHLTRRQRNQFNRAKRFDLLSEKGRKIRIRKEASLVANIDVFDDAGEKVLHRLCGHVDKDVCPLFDQLLTQKLSLEFDEDAFMSIANQHLAPAKSARWIGP